MHVNREHSDQHTGVSLFLLLWGIRSQWVNMVSTQISNNMGCIQWWLIVLSCKHAPIQVDILASLPSGPYLIFLSCASAFGELIPPVHWFEHDKAKS